MNETNKNGCYQCGSSEGSSTKLCPECTQERIEEKRRRNEPYSVARQTVDAHIPKRFYENRFIVGGLFAILVGVIAYYLLFSVYGPGLGMSKTDFIYKKCMHKFGSEIAFNANTMNSTGNVDMDKALKGSGDFLIQGMAAGICNKVKEQCSANINNPVCNAMIR